MRLSGCGHRSGLPRTFRCPGKLGEGADGAEKGRRKAAGARSICRQHLCALGRRVVGARGAPGRRECAGQGRARTAGRTRDHRLRALRCCPHPGSCPPEPFRFTSAALPAHLGWFLSERGFAVFPLPSVRAKGARRKGTLTGAA